MWACRISIQKDGLIRKATVFDLEEAELCYAPQYGAAKGPVNLVVMIAANTLRGDMEFAPWDKLDSMAAFLLGVREPHVICAGSIPGISQHSPRAIAGAYRRTASIQGNMCELRHWPARLLRLPHSCSTWLGRSQSLRRI